MDEVALPDPDQIWAQAEPDGTWVAPDRARCEVQLTRRGSGLHVGVASSGSISRVRLRWRRLIAEDSLVLGDAWERSYGELEWRAVRAEACLPWMALVVDPSSGAFLGLGVEVRGAAFSFWTVDQAGFSLWLDVRSGGAAVRPGDRLLDAAVVRAIEGESEPFAAQRALTRLLCRDPLPSPGPLVGSNNWYYAYGRNFGMDAVVRDARLVRELTDGHPVRPFGVIDDGWSPAGTADGAVSSAGPWDRGRPGTFPSMVDAAAAIAAEGVRPGIWFRPLLRRDRVAGVRDARDGAWALDPSHPTVLEVVEEDVARFAGWGFELIKHDFSTYDLLGRWGPQMGATPAGSVPPLHDPSITTAEALVGFYRRVLAGAGTAVVLGCDVVGHLAAGLQHAQRTGDDTSGVNWDRTRRVGVNTMGFRLAQHGAFFTVDADCVPSTPRTPWHMNRQYLDLVARSGTALFVSVDPTTRNAEVDSDLGRALRLALDGGIPGGIEPLDQLLTPTPSLWRDQEGEHRYAWVDVAGADPFEAANPATE